MNKLALPRKIAAAAWLTLTLACATSPASAQVTASDNATNYSGWSNGANGGFGFTPWTLTQNNGGTTYAGFYIDVGSINISTAVKSFAMYANGTGTPYAIAYRSISNSLAVNQGFKVKFQNTGIANGGYMGFCLRSDNNTNFSDTQIVLDAGTRFAFYFLGGQSDYFIYDSRGAVDSGIGWTPNGLSLEIYQLSADMYELIVKSADGSTVIQSYPVQTLGGSSAISTFAGFNLTSGGGENAFFNNFQVYSVTMVPPQIINLSPANGTIYASTGSPLSFEVTSLFSTVSSNGVSLVLNGVNQTNLTFTGSGTSDLLVSLNPALPDNMVINGTIVATDANNNHTTNNFTFNTWLANNLFIEAEDYNFGNGLWLDNFSFPQPNQSYSDFVNGGLFGSNGVDYLEYDLTGTTHPNYYRTNDLPQVEVCTDVDHDNFAANTFQDYNLGFIQNGEWEDYTRHMSNVTYTVYARMAGFGANPVMLMERSAAPTVTNASQPRASLGTFVCPQTGGAQNWTFVQLKDFFSNPVQLRLPGTNTFRLTDIGSDGSYNVNYLILVASTNTAALHPYVASGFPYPGASGIQPDQSINFVIANASTNLVVPGSINLYLNSSNVTAGITVSNNATGATVSYVSPTLLPGGTNTLQVIYADGTTSKTNNWQFTVISLPIIPTAYALPTNALSLRGFTLQVAKGIDSATNIDFPAVVSRAEAQLAGKLTNSQTLQPYVNLALNNGAYTETGVINYAIDSWFTHAYFGVPAAMPDVPTGTTNNVAMAALMYVRLSPGIYQLGVTSDDGFKFTAGTTPTSTNMTLGIFDGGRGSSETAFTFIVQTNGLYPMRLLFFKAQLGGGGVQLYTIDRNTGIRRLLNDSSDTNSLAVYQASSVLPTLAIHQSGNNVVLTWSDSSFALQSAPLVTGIYTNIPGASSPYSSPITGAQKYFRLAH